MTVPALCMVISGREYVSWFWVRRSVVSNEPETRTAAERQPGSKWVWFLFTRKLVFSFCFTQSSVCGITVCGLRKAFKWEKWQIVGKKHKNVKVKSIIVTWSSHGVIWTNQSLADILRANRSPAGFLWLSTCVNHWVWSVKGILSGAVDLLSLISDTHARSCYIFFPGASIRPSLLVGKEP